MKKRSSSNHYDEGYIIEFIGQGRYVKVSAIDPRTGTEVSIVGDAERSEEELQQVALRKLRYVLEKKGKSTKDSPDTDGYV